MSSRYLHRLYASAPLPTPAASLISVPPAARCVMVQLLHRHERSQRGKLGHRAIRPDLWPPCAAGSQVLTEPGCESPVVGVNKVCLMAGRVGSSKTVETLRVVNKVPVTVRGHDAY